MRIFLIGFMASGKSTFGRNLASVMNFSFVDTDQQVEIDTGLSILNIFREKGEVFFRETETGILNDLLLLDDVVIACGGGLPLHSANLYKMNRFGTTVFLKPPFHIITQRLLELKHSRPLLLEMGDDEFEVKLKELYKHRLPVYREASLIIDPQNSDPAHIGKIIRERYSK
jgi:shikimate kinase